MAQEFLPLCDVLFNIISLASYFCDVVFDVVTAYTLYEQNQTIWFTVALSCILLSLITCQICSFSWYISRIRKGHEYRDCNLAILISLHVFQAGVLLRYFKLFVPVDLRYVKTEVRDLCLLRMIHAFCQAAPMLLLQLYLILLKPSFTDITDLNIVSTALSLFSICWALASFNKNVRRHNVHRLVLTWLGVIFQLLWRLGTVTSRMLSLIVYATLYGYWVFLVMVLHWISMFLWLISPKNIFHGEKMPIVKKVTFSMLISFSYIFCYVNLQEVNAPQKIGAFYLTMLLENTLLVSVWIGGLYTDPWFKTSVTATIFTTFFFGMVFMVLYYRYFHVRRLKHAYEQQASDKYNSCTNCQLGECMLKSHRMPYPNYVNELSTSENSTLQCNSITRKLNNNSDYHDMSTRPLYTNNDAFNVPGVFNCKFNPVIKKKKKKPSSFVPPLSPAVNLNIPNNANSTNNYGLLQQPFWKKPLPNSLSSDHEGSVSSRVNIQQKIQEKKQQQIAELRKIEEEIRSGKLKRPHPSDISESETLRQPIPRAKKQPWMESDQFQFPYIMSDSASTAQVSNNRKSRSQTPEILLAPHYLDNTRIYYEYQDLRWKYGNNYHLPSDEMSGSSLSKHSARRKPRKRADKDKDYDNRDKLLYKSYRIPSDLDSQISLPRSYTLPREFKYYKRPKSRKTVRTDHFLASTNSSDGDVDSFDENEQMNLNKNNRLLQLSPSNQYPHPHYHHHPTISNYSQTSTVRDTPPQPPIKARPHRNTPNMHETKL